MIRPTIRSSFSWRDAEALMSEVRVVDPEAEKYLEGEFSVTPLPDLLDHPVVRTIVLRRRPSPLFFTPLSVFLYVALRRALEDVEVHDAEVADYLASLLLAFSKQGALVGPASQARRTFAEYLLEPSTSGQDCERRIVAAEAALWTVGIWHERVRSQEARRGSPGMSYYESLASQMYSQLSDARPVVSCGLNEVYRTLGESMVRVRVALNETADLYFHPNEARSLDRLMLRTSALMPDA